MSENATVEAKRRAGSVDGSRARGGAKPDVLVHCIALAVTVAVVLLLSACGAVVSGSGSTVTKQFTFAGFTRIDVSTAFDVTVVRADVRAVSVTFDDNLAQYLKIELDGQTLRIGLQPGNSYSSTHLKASVTLPDLGAVSLSGASSARVSGLQSDRSLEVGLSGASSALLVDVKAGETKFETSGAARVAGALVAASAAFDLSGGSKITLSGSAPTIAIDASGGSGLDLRDFTAARLKASMSGGTNAKVAVTGSLDATLSGGSDLEYFGNPALGQVSTSGGSHLHRGGLL